MYKNGLKSICIILFLVIACTNWAKPANRLKIQANSPDEYNVQWDTPGPGSAESMPLGNGDIGLNVWTEKNGDLLFYISKTDAWGGELSAQKDPWMQQGGVLMKLGAIRISSDQDPLAKSSSFKQILKLGTGEILVQEGTGIHAVNYRVWVDSNHPVIHVETVTASAATINVKLENWRAGLTDTILNSPKNSIPWYHHNSPTADPHLANLTFGAMIKGQGFVNADNKTLRSAKAAISQVISIYPLTSASVNGAAWLSKLTPQVAKIERLKL